MNPNANQQLEKMWQELIVPLKENKDKYRRLQPILDQLANIDPSDRWGEALIALAQTAKEYNEPQLTNYLLCRALQNSINYDAWYLITVAKVMEVVDEKDVAVNLFRMLYETLSTPKEYSNIAIVVLRCFADCQWALELFNVAIKIAKNTNDYQNIYYCIGCSQPSSNGYWYSIAEGESSTKFINMNDELADELEVFNETLDDLKADVGEMLIESITNFEDCLDLDDCDSELQEAGFELAFEKVNDIDEYLELATAMSDYDSNQYCEQIKQLCKMVSEAADPDDEEEVAKIKGTMEELGI
jgi:hypothetical protein